MAMIDESKWNSEQRDAAQVIDNYIAQAQAADRTGTKKHIGSNKMERGQWETLKKALDIAILGNDEGLYRKAMALMSVVEFDKRNKDFAQYNIVVMKRAGVYDKYNSNGYDPAIREQAWEQAAGDGSDAMRDVWDGKADGIISTVSQRRPGSQEYSGATSLSTLGAGIKPASQTSDSSSSTSSIEETGSNSSRKYELTTGEEQRVGKMLDKWIDTGRENTGDKRVTIGPNTTQWNSTDPDTGVSLSEAISTAIESNNPLLFRKAMAVLGVTTWNPDDPFFDQYKDRMMKITGKSTPEEAWAALTGNESAAVKDIWWDGKADLYGEDEGGQQVDVSGGTPLPAWVPGTSNDFSGTWMEDSKGAQSLLRSSGYSLFDGEGSVNDGAVDPLMLSYFKDNGMQPGAMMYQFNDRAKAFMNLYALVNSLKGNAGVLDNVSGANELGNVLGEMSKGNVTIDQGEAWDEVLNSIGGYTNTDGTDNLLYSPEAVRSNVVQLLQSGIFEEFQKKLLYNQLQSAYMQYTTSGNQTESFKDYLINKMGALNWI